MTIQTEDSYLPDIKKVKSLIINRDHKKELRGGGWFSKPTEVVVGTDFVVTMDYVKNDDTEWTFTCTCTTYAAAQNVYNAIKKQIIVQDPDKDLVEKAFEEAFLKDSQ